jgi:acetyl-CoA/propionyl-CoA carboxylase carboxyl transferase subunit
LATALAKLASAYASSVNAKVTVITGKAYGAVFSILGSKSLGADIVFAADCAKISIMAPEAAVEFLYADQIKAADDSAKAKDEALAEWNEQFASPLACARNGDLDDIIDYAEMRQRITAAFEMLSAKSDGVISKLHSTLCF